MVNENLLRKERETSEAVAKEQAAIKTTARQEAAEAEAQKQKEQLIPEAKRPNSDPSRKENEPFLHGYPKDLDDPSAQAQIKQKISIKERKDEYFIHSGYKRIYSQSVLRDGISLPQKRKSRGK